MTGQPMPGVIMIANRLPVGQAIEELELVGGGSNPNEWENRVLYLPL